jgi:hypothetical protein
MSREQLNITDCTIKLKNDTNDFFLILINSLKSII